MAQGQLGGRSGRSEGNSEPTLDEVLERTRNHPFFSTGGPWFAVEGVNISGPTGVKKATAHPDFAGTFSEDRNILTAYDISTGAPFVAPDNKLNRDHLDALGFEENRRAPTILSRHEFIDERYNKPLSDEWNRILKLVSEARDTSQALPGIEVTGLTYSIPGETVMVSVSSSPRGSKIDSFADDALESDDHRRLEGGPKAIEGKTEKSDLPAAPERTGFLGMFRRKPKEKPRAVAHPGISKQT